MFKFRSLLLIFSILTGMAIKIAAQDLSHSTEKVYIQTNKQHYALGDTIWMKAYVTSGALNKLSPLSEAVYIELVNQKDSIQKSIKLRLINGTAAGDFALDEACDEGMYRIRAYTQLMRNRDAVFFFDKTFNVSNTKFKETKAKLLLTSSGSALKANIHYDDPTKSSLQNVLVKYMVYSNREAVVNGKGKIDEKGDFVIEIKRSDKVDLNNAYIETYYFLNGNVEVIKSFPLSGFWDNNHLGISVFNDNSIDNGESNIIVEALARNGKHTKAEGKIISENGQVITPFQTSDLGLDFPKIDLEQQNVYRAEAKFLDGTEAVYPFPKISSNKFNLTVSDTLGKLSISINTVDKAFKENGKFKISINSGGKICYSNDVRLVDGNFNINLNVQDFPMGVANVAFINGNGEILNEQAYFIMNDKKLEVDLKLNKEKFKPRERVSVSIFPKDMKSNFKGSYAVSVNRESSQESPEDEAVSIFSSIMLAADLEGYIEKPNILFSNENVEPKRYINGLIGRQGYNKFTWKELLNPNIADHKFKEEKAQTRVKGKVKLLDGKPASGAKVTLISLNAAILEETKSDAAGNFEFEPIVLKDAIRYTVQAKLEGSTEKILIVMDEMEQQKMSVNKNRPNLNDYVPHVIKGDTESLYFSAKTRRLKEVTIKAKRLTEDIYTKQLGNVVPDGHSDLTYILRNPEFCASLGQCLQGSLPGVEFRQHRGVQYYPFSRDSTMLVFIDGRKLQSPEEIGELFDQNVIDPLDIGKIEVVRTNQALISMLGGASILIITKKNKNRNNLSTPNMVNYFPIGFKKANDFILTQYNSVSGSVVRDLRTSIYWNPNLVINQENKIVFDVSNSDQPGRYKVVFEGINEDGYLCRKVGYYTVAE